MGPLGEEFPRRRGTLEGAAALEHEHLVAVQDGAHPVGHHQQRAPPKGGPVFYRRLQGRVRRQVHRRRRFVQEHHLSFVECGPGDGEELPLSRAPVGAALHHPHLEPLARAGDKLLEARHLKSRPHLVVCLLVGRVEVEPEGPREEVGLLGDDRERFAELGEGHPRRVHAVDEHLPPAYLVKAGEGEEQRGLARARAPHHAELGAAKHEAIHAVQDAGQVRPVADLEAPKFDLSL
mmetsp:Transcript_70178/g.158704  ORF Transcript_70178/g.158704 Transcript_70178/m.158704 type:complete len:235 (-) Transcript_70178:118-822(-)